MLLSTREQSRPLYRRYLSAFIVLPLVVWARNLTTKNLMMQTARIFLPPATRILASTWTHSKYGKTNSCCRINNNDGISRQIRCSKILKNLSKQYWWHSKNARNMVLGMVLCACSNLPHLRGASFCWSPLELLWMPKMTKSLPVCRMPSSGPTINLPS